jgi:predicted aldo/keto reductase-like oxidoreductase
MLGYGAMELRGAPRANPTTEEQAEVILNAVLDAGINYIDTSIDYGVSEEKSASGATSHVDVQNIIWRASAAAWAARRQHRSARAAHMYSPATISSLALSKVFGA